MFRLVQLVLVICYSLHVTHAQSVTCIPQTKIIGSNTRFTDGRNYAEAATKEDCLSLCDEYSECLSIEYNEGYAKCQINTRLINSDDPQGQHVRWMYCPKTPGCFENADYLGDDINGCGITTASALECQEQCEGMDGCTHFTYLTADHPETQRRGQCCLKDGQGTYLSDVSYLISGPVSCGCFENADYLGDDINGCGITTASALECQQQCEGMDGCTHFTYLKEDHPETERRGQCCLKNGQGKYVPDVSFLESGPVSCDEDECKDPSSCGANAVCTNTLGGFSCACDAGYTGDGTTCEDCFENADYNGDDINGCGITTASALECQQQCEGMDGCTHFTYLKEDYPETARRGQCCLKNGQGKYVPNVSFLESGPVSCD